MTQLATDVTSAKNMIGPPPSQKETPLLRAWRTFFGTPLNGAISLACILLLVWLTPKLVNWFLLDATWSGTAQDCRKGAGALVTDLCSPS